MLADKCLELSEKTDESGSSSSEGYTRAVAVKGLVELVHGNLGLGTDEAKGTLCLFILPYLLQLVATLLSLSLSGHTFEC